MKAILLSAGYGRRLRPLTWFKPKQFVEIKGKTVIERNIEYLNKYGIFEIIVNIHHKPDYFVKHLGDKVLFSYEPELLGEERTLKHLEWWIDGATIVMNSDTLTNLDLNKMYIEYTKQDSRTLRFMDGSTYAGVKMIPFHNYTLGDVDYHDDRAYWVDCGTWEGIRRAKKLI